MLRKRFDELVTSWEDLVEFCRNEYCDICDDIYSEDEKDEFIEGAVVDWARDMPYQDLLSELQKVPIDICEYYYRNDYDEFEEADLSMFLEYKADVFEWMDENDRWEDDDEDLWETDDEEEDLVDETPLTQLFEECGLSVKISG